ncbi:MAG TPA: phosphopyruvate hydratase [Thermoproteota archaeon]|nr:phosphopyruvate hydratase [Thermoproteota archaeon]
MSKGSIVKKVRAFQILDSRGNPTVEAEVELEDGSSGRASVPSGASTGKFEAIELRDRDPKTYLGLGVQRAVSSVNEVIAPALVGWDALAQEKIDRRMLELDGTPQKSKLGGNAILSVSIATCKAAAEHLGLPLFRYLGKGEGRCVLPVPMMNVINGGKHAGNALQVQEFMVIPAGFRSYPDALRAGVETYHTLKKLLSDKYGRTAINVGDEGGFAPPLTQTSEALDILVRAIEEAGYSSANQIRLGLDCAASSFFDESTGRYSIDGRELSGGQLVDYLSQIVQKYRLASVEDPVAEGDLSNFADFTRKCSSIQVVGDDVFVTNKDRLEAGIRKGVANALLFKVNQIGTLTEAFETMDLAVRNKYRVVVSHRSGETEDSYIADIAVGKASGQIKTGAPARGERTAKYNRLLRIFYECEDTATYPGIELFKV